MALTKVTRGGIGADAIDGSKIADDTVNSEHFADGGIDNDHLATGISASKLTGALPAISGASLTGITGTTTRAHAFSVNAAGKLIWTHTEGTLSLTNSSGVDNYREWHIGSTDQVYTVNSDGKLICTYT